MICENCGCKIIRPSDSPYLCAYCYSISHPQSSARSFAGYQNRDNAIAPRVAHSSLAHGGFFFRSTLDRENLTLSTADFSPVRLPIGMCDASLNATSAGEKSFSQAVAERLPARVQPAMDGRFSICPVAVETLLETEGLIERSAAGQFNLGGSNALKRWSPIQSQANQPANDTGLNSLAGVPGPTQISRVTPAHSFNN